MNRKQSIWVIALFFITLLISVVVSIPVRQVFRFVELPADVKLQGLQGTISKGTIESLNYKNFHLAEVDFKFRPLCLFSAQLCYQLMSDDKELLLDVGINQITQNISISQSTILLDSDVFKDIPQLLAQPKGKILVFIDSLTLVDSKITNLVAKVDWLDAGIQGEDQLLGNYQALINQHEDKLGIKLSDKDSLLTVKGDIGVKWSGQYNVDLEFKTLPMLNKAVISVMQMTTKQSGLNRFTLKRSGNLSAVGLNFLNSFSSNK